VKFLLTKILFFFLAVFILFSTSSFAVDMHFCCNKLVGMSILGKAEVCKDKPQKKDALTKQCTTLQERDCCNNQNISVEGQDELKISFQSLDLNQQLFLTAFTYSYSNLFEGLPQQVVPFKNYTPPLIVKDIPVLNDTFLI
jgi:hypothetical protein